MQRTLITRRITQCPVKLELHDMGEEIAGVGRITGNVVFRTGIKVGLGAFNRAQYLGRILAEPTSRYCTAQVQSRLRTLSSATRR